MRNGLPRDLLDTTSTDRERRLRITLPAVLTIVSRLLIAAPVVAIVILGYQFRWTSEDAFISFRVVEQILAGNGPVYNAGERVEAHTNPLWVGILSIFGLFGADVVLTAAFLGALFSAAGLLAAITGALLIEQRADNASKHDIRSLAIPAGAVVFVAVPPTWDFVTSGLETGLSFGWLGISFWLLVRASTAGPQMPRWSWYATALSLGLGPLVRPDFIIFSAGFLLALLVVRFRMLERRFQIAEFLQIGLAAIALPAGYQIFRMGYYAALVPNTALAKEAGESNWEQGRVYLEDFVDPYHLWIPIALVMALAGLRVIGAARGRDWSALILLTVPILTGVLHALYVVRVGGDFMHGRLLLPALFALMMPVAVVRVPLAFRPTALISVVVIAGILVWAYIAGTSMRWTYDSEIEVNEETGIVAERAFYVDETEHPNPVTIEDYEESEFRWVMRGQETRERAENGPRAVRIRDNEFPVAAGVPDEVQLIIPEGNIGIHGYVAGTSVHLVDRLGLADPIGSRIELEERGRPGHEKALPMIWVVARYSSENPADYDDPPFASARAAIECGELAELIEATSAPMSLGRFLENIRDSWSLHNLRIPADPAEAEARFCGDEAG